MRRCHTGTASLSFGRKQGDSYHDITVYSSAFTSSFTVSGHTTRHCCALGSIIHRYLTLRQVGEAAGDLQPASQASLTTTRGCGARAHCPGAVFPAANKADRQNLPQGF